jgi:hypothetical protein
VAAATSRPIDLARLAIVDLNPVLAVLVRKYPLPVGVGAIGHVQSEAAGERVMASLERLLTKRLRLKINREKSGCVAVESRAPIVLLQIAVTRGVFKAHRVPRTPTNASSALAKAQS